MPKKPIDAEVNRLYSEFLRRPRMRDDQSVEEPMGTERYGANTWQDRDADEAGVSRTGPL